MRQGDLPERNLDQSAQAQDQPEQDHSRPERSPRPKGERDLPEWVKNILIVGLACSAFYLFTCSPLYLNSPLYGWTMQLTAPPANSEAQISFSAAARPVRMAVSNSDGRYGLQYDTAAVDALYGQTGTLLGEALGSAGPAQPVSEARWRQALAGEGIYYDFPGIIPLSALSGWLREGERNPQLSGDARRLLLAPGEGGAVWLYYQDGWDEASFYGRATALQTQAHLSPVTASFVPNGAKFAFEDSRLAACGPYTFVTSGLDRATVYEAVSPLAAGGEALNSTLAALSFSGALMSSYNADEGTVYRRGEDSLLLSPDGTLVYHGADAALYPVAREGEAPTLAEMIEATRRLTAAVLDPLCGQARVHLTSVRQAEEGEAEATVITYHYSLDGAEVWVGTEGWCAQFRVTGEGITSFTLRPRRYAASGTQTPLLPAVQAAAAVEAQDAAGGELTLLYRDTGEREVRGGWVVR